MKLKDLTNEIVLEALEKGEYPICEDIPVTCFDDEEKKK